MNECCVGFTNHQQPPRRVEDRAMGGDGSPVCSVGGGGSRRMECMRVGYINVNGMTDEYQRKDVVESFKRERLDILGVGETYMKGKGMMDCGSKNESKTLEGIEGGVVCKDGGEGKMCIAGVVEGMERSTKRLWMERFKNMVDDRKDKVY